MRDIGLPARLHAPLSWRALCLLAGGPVCSTLLRQWQPDVSNDGWDTISTAGPAESGPPVCVVRAAGIGHVCSTGLSPDGDSATPTGSEIGAHSADAPHFSHALLQSL
eukprot:3816850-Alexandrium_andersonii.AAC.1